MRLLTLATFVATMFAGVAVAQSSPVTRRRADLVLTIGGTSAGISNDTAARNISDVQVARDGRIYVLDAIDRAVKVFDAAGQFLFRFGAGGRGAGGFLAMDELRLTENMVSVRDSIQRKHETFQLDGKPLRTQLFERESITSRRYPMRGGTVLRVEMPVFPKYGPVVMPSPLYRIVGLERAPSKPLDTLFRIRADSVFLSWPKAFVRTTPVVPRFGAGGAMAILGDSIVAHADGYSGIVTWYSVSKLGARAVRTASLAHVGQSISPDEIAAESARLAEAAIYNRRAADSLREHLAEATLSFSPTQWSLATRALFSDDGSLWVGVNRILKVRTPDGTRVAVGEANTWTVFPPHGAPFTVDLRPLFRLTAVRGDKLYGYAYAENGDLLVTVYQVR